MPDFSQRRAELSLQQENKAAIERSFEAWSNGLGSPFDLLADDATWTIIGNSVVAKTYAGRETFLREVIRPFNARMSVGLRPVIRQLYAECDTVIALFAAGGTARDGHPYENDYAWFLDMREGRIVRAIAFFDAIEFDAFWRRVPPAETD
jgi:ketosteroid isomerase-like protein